MLLLAAQQADVKLVSTFAGLATFGATGLILGPVIAAVFMTLLQVSYEFFGEMRAVKPLEKPDVADTSNKADSGPT